MDRPKIVLVAALGTNRVIGLAGGIPWHLPDDLKFFKRVTMGTVLVMGRRTFDSIGKPLPGRTNVVVSRDAAAFGAAHPGVIACETLDQALAAAALECERAGQDTISVIGGGVTYAQCLSRTDEMMLTFVPYDGPGDTFFPEWDAAEWDEVSRERAGTAERVRYRRRP